MINSFKRYAILFLQLVFALSFSAQESVRIPHLELPQITKRDAVVKHLGYTLSYNEAHEQANWVAYELTADETHKSFARTNKFIPDPEVSTGSAVDADYRGSGYDRGHLAPAADMGWSEQSMSESFYFSNMSPQVPAFNRGIWKQLEEQVRDWAVDCKSLYVVTGPILTENLPAIGENRVSVPRFYYKVILDYEKPELKGIGFIIPNAGSDASLQSFAVSIDSVEKVSHINFFPALPNDLEQTIEKSICLDCWKWGHVSAYPEYKHKASEHQIPAKEMAGVKVQCSAITRAGNRCKRMTTNVSGRCTQHE